MDVYGLKQYIINNPHLIEEILEQSGFCKIRDLGDEENFFMFVVIAKKNQILLLWNSLLLCIIKLFGFVINLA